MYFRCNCGVTINTIIYKKHLQSIEHKEQMKQMKLIINVEKIIIKADTVLLQG